MGFFFQCGEKKSAAAHQSLKNAASNRADRFLFVQILKQKNPLPSASSAAAMTWPMRPYGHRAAVSQLISPRPLCPPDEMFEQLHIEAFSSPPELPDVMKPQDSGSTANEQAVQWWQREEATGPERMKEVGVWIKCRGEVAEAEDV